MEHYIAYIKKVNSSKYEIWEGPLDGSMSNLVNTGRWFSTYDGAFQKAEKISRWVQVYPYPHDKKLKTSKSSSKSRHIRQDVKDKVWNRDGRKCTQCGSNENLEFDHIIPFSKGGKSTYRNLQLLCQTCNRSKGAKF